MIWERLVIIAVPLLGGMKCIYGIHLWQGREARFFDLWREKQFYIGIAAWAVSCGIIWILSGKSAEAVQFADLFGTYGILAAVDGKRRIVPDCILFCFFTGQMLLSILTAGTGMLIQVIRPGAIFMAAAIIFAWLSKGKLGMGDARLLGVTAMRAGTGYTFSVLILALAVSFVYSIGLIAFCGKSIKTEFPFVPFLLAGMVIHMLLFGATP